MQTMKRIRNERGAALIETAFTVPLIIAVCVGIFEFGRAFQTWQVLTNAAREGARVAVLADTTNDQVVTTVKAYLASGALEDAKIKATSVTVERTVPFGSNTASKITVTYPFDFMMLNPVMQLLNSASSTGKGTKMMVSSALMRNESGTGS
jgi:Flp pilus assembly protein TadG